MSFNDVLGDFCDPVLFFLFLRAQRCPHQELERLIQINVYLLMKIGDKCQMLTCLIYKISLNLIVWSSCLFVVSFLAISFDLDKTEKKLRSFF